jgi:ribonucleoside-triphosphate reductase
MGYFRPVASFNIGKKGEHRERVHFTEKAAHAHCACDRDQFKLFADM